MSKWLILQSDGIHKGQNQYSPNWYLRECYGFQYALRKMGHEADIVGPGHFAIHSTDYDYVIVLENYDMGWLPNLSNFSGKKIQWIVDAHCQNWDTYRDVSEHCDIIWHATKSLMHTYAYSLPNKKHVWFPCCIDERYFNGQSRDKIYQLLFVGSRHPNRETFLKELEHKLNLQCMTAYGQDMIELISQTCVHVNQPISVDINARIFETIGIGTCLLTSYDPALVDLGFIDGDNCCMYQTVEEAIDKCSELLESNSWDTIGRSGLKLSRKHTIRNRLTSFLQGEK